MHPNYQSHALPFIPAISNSVAFQAKNRTRSITASNAVTKVSHWNHNAHRWTANCHLHNSAVRSGIKGKLWYITPWCKHFSCSSWQKGSLGMKCRQTCNFCIIVTLDGGFSLLKALVSSHLVNSSFFKNSYQLYGRSI